MCGILSIFGLQPGDDVNALRKRSLALVKRIRHRGPDWSGIASDERAILAHERLAIVGVADGAQPLRDESESLFLAVNGEIYNHRELARKHAVDYPFQTKSDCEVILPLFQRHGTDFLNLLNGIYAFTLYDRKSGGYLIARDPMGVIPLYWGWDADGHLYVASELKALIDDCVQFEEFPPGHYYWQPADAPADNAPIPFYDPTWASPTSLPDTQLQPVQLRDALEEAVVRQMMCDVPFGLLLSGGLDSSIIAAIAAQHASKRIETNEQSPAWWPQLHSFTIGLEGAPDLPAAREVADAIGTIHHEYHFTPQEGFDALSDVIYHLETYDITTIRASTPMYLLSRKIKAMGIKMLLSGEGADEIFGGYLYFHKAPNAEEFHRETVRKLQRLHLYDCLRANKSTAAWGVEARVPFLDLAFLEVAMNMDPAQKMIAKGGLEKQILRDAFADVLPASITARQKEQFSDGVGYSWIDGLKARAEEEVSDEQMSRAKRIFPINPPATKEGFWYRSMFAAHYPGDAAAQCVPGGASIACSTETAIAWDASFANQADPSGRAVLGIHLDEQKLD